MGLALMSLMCVRLCVAALETPNYSLQTPQSLNRPPSRGGNPRATEEWLNSSISPKVSPFDTTKSAINNNVPIASQKVFHADTVTVSSPASAVLSQSPLNSNAPGGAFVQRSSSPSPLLGSSASAHRRTLSAGNNESNWFFYTHVDKKREGDSILL